MAMVQAKPPFSWWKFARTFTGLLLAPVAGGAAGIFLFSLPDLASGNGDMQDLLGVTAFGAYFGAIFGLVPALILGWPVHLLLLRQGWTSIWVYLGLGALIGVLGFPLTGMAMGAWS